MTWRAALAAVALSAAVAGAATPAALSDEDARLAGLVEALTGLVGTDR